MRGDAGRKLEVVSGRYWFHRHLSLIDLQLTESEAVSYVRGEARFGWLCPFSVALKKDVSHSVQLHGW